MLYVMYVSSGYRQLYPSVRLSPFRYIPTLRASSRPFQMLINGRAEECQLQCGARERFTLAPNVDDDDDDDDDDV